MKFCLVKPRRASHKEWNQSKEKRVREGEIGSGYITGGETGGVESF